MIKFSILAKAYWYLEVTEKLQEDNMLSKWSLVTLKNLVHSQFSSEFNYFVGSISVSSKIQLPSTAEENTYKMGFVELK